MAPGTSSIDLLGIQFGFHNLIAALTYNLMYVPNFHWPWDRTRAALRYRWNKLKSEADFHTYRGPTPGAIHQNK